MEGESPLLKDGALSLQTSHSHRELPPRAPACTGQRFVLLCTVRVLLGEVFCVSGGRDFLRRAAVALVWWMGRVARVSFISADLSPLISRLRAKLLAVFFPPEGKPSVGSASLIMRASNFNPSKNILQKSKSALQKASPNEKVTHHSLPLQGGRKLQAV